MAQTNANSGSSVVRNNSSFILNGGTITNTANTATKTLAQHSVRVGPFKVVVPETTWTKKATNSGTFANQVAGKYVIQGNCSELARIADTNLNKAGASRGPVFTNSPLESIKTLKQITAGWNYATGAFLSAPSTVTTSFGSDNEGRPSRTNAGEWSYHYGASAPKSVDYPAKTG